MYGKNFVSLHRPICLRVVRLYIVLVDGNKSGLKMVIL